MVSVVVVVECQNKSNIGEQERRRGQQPTVRDGVVFEPPVVPQIPPVSCDSTLGPRRAPHQQWPYKERWPGKYFTALYTSETQIEGGQPGIKFQQIFLCFVL